MNVEQYHGEVLVLKDVQVLINQQLLEEVVRKYMDILHRDLLKDDLIVEILELLIHYSRKEIQK